MYSGQGENWQNMCWTDFRVRTSGGKVRGKKESRRISRYLGLRNLEYLGAGSQDGQETDLGKKVSLVVFQP